MQPCVIRREKLEHGGDGYSGGGGYCDWEENCDYYHTNATWYGGTDGGDGKSKNEGFGGHGTGIKGQGFFDNFFSILTYFKNQEWISRSYT